MGSTLGSIFNATVDDELPAAPDCSKPKAAKEAAYCRAVLQSATDLEKIRTALPAIRAVSDAGREVADVGTGLLNSTQILLFVPLAGDPGGASVAFGNATIATYWTDVYATRSTVEKPPRNLRHALTHEIEHVMNRGHIDPPGNFETPHSRECSGL